MNSTEVIDEFDVFEVLEEFEETLEEEFPKRFALEIILFLLGASGILLDGLIVYIIVTYRKMRTPQNMFLASWSLADGLTLFWTPLNYKILLHTDYIPSVARCILAELESIMHCIVVLSMILVTLDWCLANYFPERSEKLRLRYTTTLEIMWGIPFVLFVVNLILCVAENENFVSFFLSSFGVIGLGVFILILHVIRAINRCRSKIDQEPVLLLLLSTVYILSLVATFFILTALRKYDIHFSNFILESILYTTAARNFLIMLWLNPDFKSYVRQALSCSRHKYVEDNYLVDEPMPNQTHVQRSTSYIEFHSITNDRSDEANIFP